MEYHEGHHAFLIASYYAALTDRFGSRGLEAFRLATRSYGYERGLRMAQRAVRLGLPLNHETYLRMKEFAFTGLRGSSRSEVTQISPDYAVRIDACPWHDQFAAMGRTDCGAVYCAEIDRAICRGFDPELRFDVEGSLNDGPCCVQIVRDTRYDAPPGAPAYAQFIAGFDYHCAHLYYTFRRTARAIFGPDGDAAARDVMARFAEEYGPDAPKGLMRYEGVDFSDCDGAIGR